MINGWFAGIVCVPCVPAQVCVHTWTQQKYTKDPCMITTNQSRQRQCSIHSSDYVNH